MGLSFSVTKPDSEKRQLYALREGNNVVARAVTRQTPIGEVRFSDLYVEPKHRRMGLAEKIISEVKAKNKGKAIVLRARPFGEKGPDLDSLKDFYRRMGFEDESKAEDRMIIKKAADGRRELFKRILGGFVRNESPILSAIPSANSALSSLNKGAPKLSRREFNAFLGSASAAAPGLTSHIVAPPLTLLSTLGVNPTLPAKLLDNSGGITEHAVRAVRNSLVGRIPSSAGIFKHSAAEGIPDRTRFGKTEDIPTAQELRLVLQKHLAERAGPHTDVRLGPQTGMHYSWATKKGPLPKPGEKILWHQQPWHTASYADFEGELKGGYGKGHVSKLLDAKVSVSEATPDKIKFTVISKGEPEYYTLIRSDYGPSKPRTERERYTQGGSWLIINTTPTNTASFLGVEPDKIAKMKYRKVPAEEVDKLFQEGNIIQNKVDGASAILKLFGDRIEATSYRASTSGAPVIHTQRLFGLGGANVKLPKDLEGTLLRGEIYGTNEEGKAIPPQELGGLLNSSIAKSLADQKARGIKMKVMPFDIVGEEDKPYAERLQKLQRITELLPKDQFHLPESATTLEEQRKLWETIRSGQHPLTSEGIVAWPKEGRPTKVKLTPEADVWVKGVVPGKGRLAGSAGGFEYSTSPEGQSVGRVGSGLTDASRREMMQEPEKWLGRMARIRAQGKFPSGAYRAPTFIARHEDYAAV